jgi:hypothetical protein
MLERFWHMTLNNTYEHINDSRQQHNNTNQHKAAYSNNTMTIKDLDPTARNDPEEPPSLSSGLAKALEDVDLEQPVPLTDPRVEEAPPSLFSQPTPLVALAASLPNQDQLSSSSQHKDREFPDVFYCPITKELLEDPVVNSEGDSYERHAISERGDNISSDQQLYYSNRALKQLIDEQIELSGDSIRAGLKRFDRTVRTTFHHLMEKSALPSSTEQHHPLPEAYYCSITFNLMHDPVLDPDGHTYERVAIENWIQVNGKSPATRTALSVNQLYPNRAIQKLLEYEKNRSDDTIHPAILKFKAEKPPQHTDQEMGGNVVANQQGDRGDANSGGGSGTNTNTNTMPTTQAEIDARQTQQNRANCTQFGILVGIIVLILFVPYGLYVAWGICCCVCFMNRQRRQTD